MLNLNPEQTDIVTDIVISTLNKSIVLLERNSSNDNKISSLKAISQVFAMTIRLNGLELGLISKLGRVVITMHEGIDFNSDKLTVADAIYLNNIYEEALGFVSSWETTVEILNKFK